MLVTNVIGGVTQAEALSLGTTATRILNTRKASCVVHINNTHASQDMYIAWRKAGLLGAMTITSTTAYEKIPAGESRQFQMSENVEFWGAGSNSATTGMAVEMSAPA